MPGIAFDQAAEYYDATRGFAPGVAEQIRDAMVAYTKANEQTRLLELGVGTGRIALPFLQQSYDYTGIDLSRPMLQQLVRKLEADPGTSRPPYKLVQGDVTHLPLAGSTFDVIITVHVLHLVDDWQQTLREAIRVLRKPGGYLFIAYDDYPEEAVPSANKLVNDQWDQILREFGITRDELLPGLKEAKGDRNDQLETLLHQLGAQTRLVTLLEHATLPVSPRAMAQRHIQRMYSADWLLPDEVHAAAVKRLEEWLSTECPEPDRALSGPAHFKALVAHL